jgi:hypothetical protein
MIASLIALLGSSAVGSLIGGIFAFLNRRTDIAVKEIELAHEKDKWANDLLVRQSDLEIAREEAKGKLDVAVAEGDAAYDTARMAAVAEVQKAEQITADEIKAAGTLGWLFVLASVFNKLIRPVLTVLLAGAALYLNWMVINMMVSDWPSMTIAQRFEAGMQAFAWVTAQASTAFSYWFVSRGSSK